MITHLSSYVFPLHVRLGDFTFIIDVGELIFSGQTEVTVYENEQLIFPMCL